MADKNPTPTFRRSKNRGGKPRHFRFTSKDNVPVSDLINYLRKFGVSVNDEQKKLTVPQNLGIHVLGQADALIAAGYYIVRA